MNPAPSSPKRYRPLLFGNTKVLCGIILLQWLSICILVRSPFHLQVICSGQYGSLFYTSQPLPIVENQTGPVAFQLSRDDDFVQAALSIKDEEPPEEEEQPEDSKDEDTPTQVEAMYNYKDYGEALAWTKGLLGEPFLEYQNKWMKRWNLPKNPCNKSKSGVPCPFIRVNTDTNWQEWYHGRIIRLGNAMSGQRVWRERGGVESPSTFGEFKNPVIISFYRGGGTGYTRAEAPNSTRAALLARQTSAHGVPLHHEDGRGF